MTILFSFVLILTFAGCSSDKKGDSKKEKVSAEEILIVYNPYSEKTEEIANLVQEKIGGDSVKLEEKLPDIKQYDRIFVGDSASDHTISASVMSFLEQMDFNGKEVIPFWTEAEEYESYEQEFGAQVQDAVVMPGLGVKNTENIDKEEINQLIDGWLTTALTLTDLQKN